MITGQNVRLLTELPLFDGIARGELGDLLMLSDWQEFPPGALVFVQGSAARGAFLVVEGVLDVIVGAGAEERAVGEVKAGEVVGELALFTEGAHRSASVRSRRRSACLLLTRTMLAQGSNNAAVVAIERQLVVSLAARLRKSNETLKELWREGAEGK